MVRIVRMATSDWAPPQQVDQPGHIAAGPRSHSSSSFERIDSSSSTRPIVELGPLILADELPEEMDSGRRPRARFSRSIFETSRSQQPQSWGRRAQPALPAGPPPPRIPGVVPRWDPFTRLPRSRRPVPYVGAAQSHHQLTIRKFQSKLSIRVCDYCSC